MKRIKKFLKMGLDEKILLISRKIHSHIQSKRAFAKEYTFDNRQIGAENLFLILAGFQPYYWDEVFSRVLKNIESFEEPIDVCVCIPEGLKGSFETLRESCSANSWSFLYIPKDLLAQVQNTAIKLHPKAKWIYKIDEDILLSSNYLSRLKHVYNKADIDNYYPIGFMGPLLNVNAACAPFFLQVIDAYDEFKQKYGDYRIKWGEKDDIIHNSPDLAHFIWEKSIPFDDVSESIYKRNNDSYFVSPVRYSIGAILFKRSYWEKIGYFKVGLLGDMGIEEEQVCGYNNINYCPIFVAQGIFAGHLGYYTQKETCRQFFEENAEDIFLKKDSFKDIESIESHKLYDTRRGG